MLKYLVVAVISLHVSFSAGAEKPMLFGTETLPPFNYLDDKGHVVGPGAEVVREVCENLTIECQIEMYPIKRLISMMSNAELNGIITMGKNKARERDFYFSKPYAMTQYGFFVPKAIHEDIRHISQFEDYTIVTLYGSNMLATLEDVRKRSGVDFEILTETTLQQAFKKLAFGRYQTKKIAIFSNRDIGQYIMRMSDIKQLDYRVTQKTLHYYIGLPKNAVKMEFVKAFNQSMDKLYQNGRLQQILEKHFVKLPDQTFYMN
ncbi:transporter substrate-binding domain-containing protein [Terasakiella sp. A23]|uniref:substrate-binding periplasmic protein n=1 Tax=Terasakiella sp. FCG-A23 TaxID=3080561 RepID=UPI002955768F|nr:transporter substrate-binding domain-containing protein [Terasakiella sp. A23]MDV7339817.1 transporter substrate-binding domain-containing protein [Terasakiella sp. A23]